jgi:hypothetical protein
MARKTIILFLSGIFICSLWSGDVLQTLGERNESEEAGYILLDQVLGMFQGMAATGSGGKDKVEKGLDGMMATLKKEYAEGRIDPVFFRGYQRLLMVIKLALVEDQEGIFGPLIQKEVGGYILEMMGEEVDLLKTKSIGAVANAIAQGILSLHLYLDTKKDREKLMEKWESQLGPPAQKKK